MKTTVTMLFAVAMLCALVACGDKKEIEKADPSKVLTVLRGDKSEILDPHATNSGGDANLIQQMYEGLVRPSDTPPVKWEPCLAESWTNDAAFTKFTFKIRKGVKFHDGADLDAAAVKRSYDRERLVDDKGNPTDPAAPPKLPYQGDYFSCIDTIETPDSHTVVFNLKDSNPKFVASTGLFSASVVSPKAIKHLESLKTGKDRQTWLTRNSAGTGPFELANYKDAQTITMKAFEGYWDGAPAVKTVVFKWSQDAKDRREQIIAGSVHLIDSPAPADWKDIEGDDSVTLYSWKAENLCYLGMNTAASKGFATSNVNVRKAIACAIQRDPMVSLYDGTAVSHHVLLPPVTMGFPRGYKPSTDTGSEEERLARGKQLLKDAGIENLELRLIFPAVPRPYLGKPDQVADLVRQQLAKIGITVKLEKLPMSELGDAITNGNAPLVLIGWMGETGEPDDFWRPLLSGNGKPGDSNVPRFYNEGVAAKIDTALKAGDVATREKLYIELEKSVHEEHRPMVPLLSAMQAIAWRSEVEGLFVDSTGTYRLAKAKFKLRSASRHSSCFMLSRVIPQL
ncbi:MAG: ABC transporter substrate-binding protein [Planctomycetota bacterium]|jgi:ABC-type transport system substrate-binding protein